MNEPVIQKDVVVEVYPVTNGYLVKLPHDTRRGEYSAIESSLVFQSFAALSSWMAAHFSHRDTGVKNDA